MTGTTKSSCRQGMIAVLFISSIAVSCATHPLPEDSSGVSTYDIIQKIRCEAKDAVIDSTAELLKRSKVTAVVQLGEKMQAERLVPTPSIYSQVDRETDVFLRKYDSTAVAFDFTFTMTENNDSNVSVNFLASVLRGTDGLNFSAGNMRERQNIRNVRIIDTFVSLLEQQTPCDMYASGTNTVYPITGRVGLFEVLDSFFKLNETGSLKLGLQDKTSLFADTLKFTTSINGTINPSITISPVGRNLSLGSASGTFTAKRSDVHQLIVAISLPPDVPEAVGRAREHGVTARDVRRSAAKNKVNELVNFQIDKNRQIPLGVLSNQFLLNQ